MRRKLALIALFAGLTHPAWAGELVDRIVATVNGNIILQSDWDDEVRYEAFLNAVPPGQSTPQQRQAALQRLIDQELLREQVRESDRPRSSPEALDQRVKEVRKQYSEASTETGWQALLARYGLDEAELRQRVALQMQLTGLVDDRLSTGIQIDPGAIEDYYNQQFLPRMRQAGAQPVPLEQVTPQIRQILTQKKLDELSASWLESLRSSSEISINSQAVPAGGAQP